MRRTFRHWSPTYVADRLRVFGNQRLHPQWPWLTADMVKILEGWLQASDRGLEWGSGRSTIWFAQRVGCLVSIEDNATWANWVRTALFHNGLNNVEYHVVTSKEEYVAAGDGPFDFVLVDGMDGTRDLCALRAISLLRPGGALIVDNCNWFIPGGNRSPNSVRLKPATEKWAEFQAEVTTWRKIWTSDGVTDTALWLKPYYGGSSVEQVHPGESKKVSESVLGGWLEVA